MRNDLGLSALLAEEPLEHVGGARCASMRNRKLQVRDAGVEVVQETARCARAVALLARDEIVFEHLRDLRTAGLVGGERRTLELAPDLLGHFALQVSDLVREAPLAKTARKHLFGGSYEPRRAVGDHPRRDRPHCGS